MRGLTDEERAFLVEHLPPCRGDDGEALGMNLDVVDDVIAERLDRQGRVLRHVPCKCGVTHVEVTSAGKLALELDTIARTKGEFGL